MGNNGSTIFANLTAAPLPTTTATTASSSAPATTLSIPPNPDQQQQQQQQQIIAMFGQTIFSQRECKKEMLDHEKCAQDNNLKNPQTEAEKAKLRDICRSTIQAISKCVGDPKKWDKLIPEASEHTKCKTEAEQVRLCKERQNREGVNSVDCRGLVFAQINCGLTNILEDTVKASKSYF